MDTLRVGLVGIGRGTAYGRVLTNHPYTKVTALCDTNPQKLAEHAADFGLSDRMRLNVALHADNLLNRRYYDHTSYYRLIDVPEPGRNISVKVGLEF